MHVIHRPAELHARKNKVCVAIGMFDGLHLGHQQVIRQMVEEARQGQAHAVAMTFDRHPNSVVAPERTPPLIYPLSKKIQLLASLGVETTLMIHFDEDFSRLSAEDFIRDLVSGFGALSSVYVGSGFAFGHRRQGRLADLKRLGQIFHFKAHGLAAVSLDGKIVSSTRIRAAIRNGDLSGASQLLGRAYALVGKVVPGAKRGRQLGFPTANLDVAGLVLPPNGIYAAQLSLDGNPLKAAVNIGSRPTVDPGSPKIHVEAHILDFSGDLYDRELELVLRQKLREEERFASLEQLRDRINRDVESTRAWFDANG